MDIPSMIKVNELSKTFKDKGIAESSEDATKMAEEVLKKDMPHASQETEKEIDKVDIILERTKRQFSNEMSSLKKQLVSLVNEINFIKEDMKKLKQAKEQPKVIEKPVSQEQNQKKKSPEEKQESLQTKKQETQAEKRTGGIKPGDVNIEDYFYYGTKKKG